MSLRDTIEGARDEAKVTVDTMTKKSKDAAEKPTASDEDRAPAAYDPFKSGKANRETWSAFRQISSSRSAAREAASSVRVEGERSKKSPALMTKEEKKAAKAEERRLEDARNQAYDYILKSDDAYKKTDKTWWILLGVGFGMTVISLLLAYVFPTESKEYTTAQGIAAIVTLVLAYGFIIAAFIYDFRKRRPFRKAAERRLQGMNDKRVADYIASEDEKAARAAAKAEAQKAEGKAVKGK